MLKLENVLLIFIYLLIILFLIIKILNGERDNFEPNLNKYLNKSGNSKIVIKNIIDECKYIKRMNCIILDGKCKKDLKYINDPIDPNFVNILRYILAGLAVLISFTIGFFTLARTIPKAMEALGRNPLARTTIQFGIVLNIIFTIGIGLVGVVAAIILLRF